MSRKKWSADKLFYRLLNNKSDRTYYENLRELRIRGTKEIFDRSYQLVTTGNDQEKEVAIHVLAQLGGSPSPFHKQTIELCFELLKSVKNSDVLCSILYTIGHNNQKLNASQIALISLFKDNTGKDIRQALVAALSGLNNKTAINILIELSTDRITSIRSWATFGIATQIHRKAKNITDALWNRIDDKDQETRYEALVGLAIRKDARVKDIIKREILTGSFGTLLFEAIEELGDIEFLPVLEKIQEESSIDTGIYQPWLNRLNTCIEELKEKKSLLH